MAEPNPRAVSGDNTDAIDYAKLEVDRLRIDYAPIAETAIELEHAADQIPDEIPDGGVKETVVDLIKRGRDLVRRADVLREVEKQPHYRRGQGADQFFFGIIDRLAKRERRNRDGAMDVLQSKLTAYDTRKLLEEQARRREEALAAEREATRLRAVEAERARLAEEARLAAERARKPETAAAKEGIAAAAETLATEAGIDASLATNRAEAAYVDTLARPADIMRTRTSAGSLSTMATEKYAEIEDATLLDKGALWPYISFAEKEKALRAWAKGTGHNQQMTGAKIGDRPKSVVR